MKKRDKSKSRISRRKFLPFLGGSLFLPFSAAAQSVTDFVEEPDPSYKTMLTQDGKIVRVRTRAVEKSEVVHKKMSNKSLHDWLDKNEDMS